MPQLLSLHLLRGAAGAGGGARQHTRLAALCAAAAYVTPAPWLSLCQHAWALAHPRATASHFSLSCGSRQYCRVSSRASTPALVLAVATWVETEGGSQPHGAE